MLVSFNKSAAILYDTQGNSGFGSWGDGSD